MHRGTCSILDVGTVWRKWRRCFRLLFIGKSCSKNDAVKSYREKIVLKTLQLEFRCVVTGCITFDFSAYIVLHSFC